MTDFEVVWSGAHLGCNADLLCVDDRLKVAPVAPRRRGGRLGLTTGMQDGSNAMVVFQCVEAHGPLSSLQVARQTGLTPKIVRGALAGLRLKDAVVVTGEARNAEGFREFFYQVPRD